jgi:hypothetical protein
MRIFLLRASQRRATILDDPAARAKRASSQIYDPSNHWNALTDGRTKYVYWAAAGFEQLFDLARDPAESCDLADVAAAFPRGGAGAGGRASGAPRGGGGDGSGAVRDTGANATATLLSLPPPPRPPPRDGDVLLAASASAAAAAAAERSDDDDPFEASAARGAPSLPPPAARCARIARARFGGAPQMKRELARWRARLVGAFEVDVCGLSIVGEIVGPLGTLKRPGSAEGAERRTHGVAPHRLTSAATTTG